MEDALTDFGAVMGSTMVDVFQLLGDWFEILVKSNSFDW